MSIYMQAEQNDDSGTNRSKPWRGVLFLKFQNLLACLHLNVSPSDVCFFVLTTSRAQSSASRRSAGCWTGRRSLIQSSSKGLPRFGPVHHPLTIPNTTVFGDDPNNKLTSQRDAQPPNPYSSPGIHHLSSAFLSSS